MSWDNVVVVGVIHENKRPGRIQLCRHLLKLHQARPGGSNYVGFLVSDRTLTVYVSNAAGLVKSLPIDLSVGQDSLSMISDCIRIFRHAENLYVPPFQENLECLDQQNRSYHFTSPKLFFVKETMIGSRTAVWKGSLKEDMDQPAILKSCWLPHHLINHERKLVNLLSAKQPWGIIPFAISGARLKNGVRQVTPHDNQDFIRYQEVSISLDNDYRAFERHIGSTLDWITIIAGISDIARIVFLVWSKCRIHHRDISNGNIVFAPIPATDPDSHSKVAEFLGTRETDITIQPDRSSMACLIDWTNGRSHSTGQDETPLEDKVGGTRPFLSIKMLRIADPRPPMNPELWERVRKHLGLADEKEQTHHLPIDDLESLYWVLIWFSAQGNDDVLKPWRCSNGGELDKNYLAGDNKNQKIRALDKLMTKWDCESPLAKPIFELLLDLSETIKKLEKAFGRKGELENDPTHPDYQDDLVKADTEWAPLFFEFVQRLDKTVSDLYNELC